MRFYRLTGETKFLARIPEALDWLEGLTLPPGVAPRGGTHPTFVEIGTNRPLYVHRDRIERRQRPLLRRLRPEEDARRTTAAFRRIDVAGLRKQLRRGQGDATRRRSRRLAARAGRRACTPLPRFFAVGRGGEAAGRRGDGRR